jgi:hypothetical protein
METIPAATIFALAFLTEGVTEYFFTGVFARLKLAPSYLKQVSAVVGVVLCLTYRVDALSLLFGLSPRWELLGQVLTGLLLGRGANFVHDLYTRYGRRP